MSAGRFSVVLTELAPKPGRAFEFTTDVAADGTSITIGTAGAADIVLPRPPYIYFGHKELQLSLVKNHLYVQHFGAAAPLQIDGRPLSRFPEGEISLGEHRLDLGEHVFRLVARIA